MKTLLALLLLIPSLSWGLDQDELREQLRYWKSLLDDELINQEDYDKQKEKLINLSNNINTDKAEEINEVDEDKNNKIDNTSEDFTTTLSDYQLRSVQLHLRQLGLYKGSIDGLLGPKTISAMKTWMESKNNFNNVFEYKDFADLQSDKFFLNTKKQAELGKKKYYCKSKNWNVVVLYSECEKFNKVEISKEEYELNKNNNNYVWNEDYDTSKYRYDGEFKKEEIEVDNQTNNNTLNKIDNGSTMQVDMSYRDQNYLESSIYNSKKITDIEDKCRFYYSSFWISQECVSQNIKKNKLYSKGRDLLDIYISYGDMLSLQVLGGEINDSQAIYYINTKRLELFELSKKRDLQKLNNFSNSLNIINKMLYGNTNNFNYDKSISNGHKICSIDKMGRNINSPTSTYSIQCY